MIAGIDVGSTYLKVVWLSPEGALWRSHCEPTGINPDDRVAQLLEQHPVRNGVATGYGRHMIRSRFDFPVVTEIKAHARAVHEIDDRVTAALDLGGQDSKSIRINPDGGFGDFLMNDRCAAGTGKFLELSAARMGVTLAELDDLALHTPEGVSISSMCAVFAESEIISLMARKIEPGRIARGIMTSIAGRLANMARKIGTSDPIMFTGGGARSRCLHQLLESELGATILVPENPQFMGALGAAHFARRMA